MTHRVTNLALFGLYQATVAVGILLLPVALLARRTAGVTLPVHRMVERFEDAYTARTE